MYIALCLLKDLICIIKCWKPVFSFPEKLEDWISPQWENFDLRKNPLTPWLTPEMINKIKDFETVLNGYYPTVSDMRLTRFKRKIIQTIASIRYKTGLYRNLMN